MKKWCIILAIAFTFGCEEVIEGPNNSISSDLIVVEGLLTNEFKNHTVKITRPYSNQNETTEPIAGATVAIFDSEENFFLLQESPAGSGIYLTEPFRALFGRFYVLFIEYEGKEYRAFDSPPGGELLEPLVLEETSVNSEPFYSIPYIRSGLNPNYITYDIDWSQTENCSVGQSCTGRLINYDLKNTDVQEIYAPDKDVFLLPTNSRVIRKRHSLSEQHVAYLRSLLSETEWRGGLFDIDRSNIPTNLSEGAIGFFGVSTVVSDTIFVNN